jgi:hypothetical protein
MEPLTPNDPLWNLLGKTKPVEPRPNFVQNVVREARQTPQEQGWLSTLKAWWLERELGHAPLAWAAAAVIVIAGISLTFMPQTEAPQVVAQPAVTQDAVLSEADFLVPEFETEWKNLETMGSLLAVQDTSELTDREIHLLLY